MFKIKNDRWSCSNKRFMKRVFFDCSECGQCASKLLRTNLKKFEFICSSCLRKRTSLKKYGVEHPTKLQITQEKKKTTCLKRYGVDNPSKLKKIQEKKTTTCLKNLGVCHPSYSEEVIKKIQDTKRKNGTFHTSRPEDKAYEMSCQKYPIVIRQYSEDRYPFPCNFYIPESDLFIEYNEFWSHSTEKFDDSNIAHLQKLDSWESKGTVFYKNAIKTWTVRDVKKRECAAKNNLKFIEVYSLRELELVI